MPKPKQTMQRLRALSVKPLAWAICACLSGTALAMPVGPQVVAGSAAVSQTGNQLTIQNSANAILNWQKFGIAASEIVRFQQPSASSAVLNRVVGSDPSQIYGQLFSNGKVWLINPAGVLVGPGGRIDTAGFVASTLGIANQDFFAGRLNFQKGTTTPGSVINQGTITTPSGGSVYLIGANASNEGVITTPQGETILAAGETVNLLDTSTPGVKVEITGAAGNATNLGTIAAEAGRIGLAGVLVKNSGSLNASSVVSDGGRIFLKAKTDTYVDGNANVSATGTRGGQIDVLGERVAVTDHASLDASGTNGGGTVLVGGDTQGQNPQVQNASISYFGPSATIDVDAKQSGDGGKAIVWANDTTRAYGRIFARGGALLGNGGFVETSGKYLDAARAPDVSATHGRGGQWLLDPVTITIDSAGGANIGASSPFTPTAVGTPSVLLDSVLQSAIAAGSTVTVDTTNSFGATDGNIVVAPTATALNSLNAGASAALNLWAANDVQINTSIKNTGQPLTMNFIANKYGSATTGVIGLANNVQIVPNNATVTLSAKGGITLGTGALITTGNIVADAGGWADINLTATAGDITVGAGSQLMAGQNINIGATNVSLDGSVIHKQSTVGGPSGTASITASGSITQYAAFSSSDVNAANTFNVSMTATNAANVFGPITSGNGNVSISGSSITTVAAGDIAAGTGTVNLSSTGVGALTSIPAGSAISGNTINIKTDQLSLIGTLSGTTVGITRKNAGPELQLGLGATDATGATPSLGITDTELSNITATTYRFGDTVSDGGLRLKGPVSLGAGKTLSLLTSTVSNSQIVQNAGAKITADYLYAEGTAVTLNEANMVGALAGKAKGQTFSFNNGKALTIGTVDGQSGVDASQSTQNVTFVTTGGGMSGSGPIKGGILSITAAGNVSLMGANAVTGFKADVSSSTVKSDVFFKNTQSLDIAAGGINSYTLLGDVGLWLTSGDLTQTGLISGAKLVVRADQGNVTLTQPNAVVDLAASVGTPGVAENKNFRYNDANTLNVGKNLTSDPTFNTVVGISVAISGTTTPPVTTGIIDLSTVTGDITQSAGALLGGRAVRAVAASGGAGTGNVTLNEANYTGIIAGSAGSAGYGGNIEYTSQNGIFVTTVNAGTQSAGLSTPNAASHISLTSSGGNIGQDAPISTKSLTMQAPNGIMLTNTGNALASVSAKSSTADISVVQSGEPALTVAGATNLTGGPLSANIAFTNLNAAGTLTVSSPLTAGSDMGVWLEAPGMLNINAAVSGSVIGLATDTAFGFGGGSITATAGSLYPGLVQIATYTPGTAIDVKAAPTGAGAKIATASLAGISAPWVVFGSKSVSYGSGALTVANVIGKTVATGGSFATAPSVLAFLSGAGASIGLTSVTAPGGTLAMSAGTGVTGTGLQATAVLGEARGGTLNLQFASGFSVGALPAVAKWDKTSESPAGLHATADVIVTATAGNITIDQPVTAAASSAAVDAPAGTISGLSFIKGPLVSLVSANGIGTAGSPLATAGSSLYASATNAGGVYIANNSAAYPGNAMIGQVDAPYGNVQIDNWGALTVGYCSGSCFGVSAGGSINLTAHSPITVTGPVTSTGSGAITLTAGAAGSSVPSDVVTVNYAPSTAGTITLAGYSVTGSAVPANAIQSVYNIPPPTGPTLSQCTADPTLSGCSTVLPSLSSCTTDPTLAGCSVVLPTLATCTTNPTTAGCSAVLPSVDVCVTTPTAAGCTAVLPTLATCTTNPATAGCSAVLPTLATCVSAPATAGCAAVLPTLATCTAAPATTGCSVVLPTLSACIAAPTTAGCSVVLPTMATCIAASSTTGCSAVLPTLATCTANPTAAGCMVVLPTLATCMSAPTTAGCTAVLPSIAACVSAPTTVGCGVVLPTLSACIASPSTPGCSVVLPSLSSCTTNPTLEGCMVVLPSLASCTANPKLEGCAVVLPAAGTDTTTKVVINEIQTSSDTTSKVTDPTPNIPLSQSPGGVLSPASANQTIGNTEGTFGGSTGSGASGTGTGSTASGANGTGTGDKTAKADEKKDEKKDDKKDEAPPPKPDEKPQKKTVGRCTS